MYKKNSKMTFGIFLLNTLPPWKTESEELKDGLEQIKLADELGFNAAWVAEHNARDYGIVSSSSVYLAAAAGQTKQIKLATGVARLPLYHPLKLADDLALLDVISDGRLYVGVGKGYDRLEYEAYDQDFDQRDEKQLESLEILKSAFQNEKVTYSGKFFNIKDIPRYPKPIQKPHPPIFEMVSRSDASIIRTAKNGHSFILGGAELEDMSNKAALYRASSLEAGYSEEYINEVLSRSGTLAHVYVADTTEQAIQEYKDGLMHYMHIRETRGNIGNFPAQLNYEAFIENEGSMIGSPEKVIQSIKEFKEKTGLGHIICWFNCGGQPQEQVLKSMRLFAKEVVPEINN